MAIFGVADFSFLCCKFFVARIVFVFVLRVLFLCCEFCFCGYFDVVDFVFVW